MSAARNWLPRRGRGAAGGFLLSAGGLFAATTLVGAGFAGPTGGPGLVDCRAPFDAGARRPEVTLLVAAPRPDTVPAGLAESGRPVFGQLADLRRAGGAAGDRVEAALRSGGHVVLVPWGFDDECRPTRWTGSWSWSPTGSEGFYRGELRTADRWIDGSPTFDVYFAVWEGFPSSPWEHPLGAGQRRLDADELFDLYLRLPTPDQVAERPYGSVSDLVAWRRESGDVADRYPARGILAAAFALAERERIRTAELPYAGTYRMRILQDDATVATFYLRTGGTADSPWEMPSEGSAHAPSAPMPATAVAAPVYLASSIEGLSDPSMTADSDGARSCRRSDGLHVRADEQNDVDGARRVWPAEIPLALISACLGDDEVLRQLREARRVPADRDDSGGSFSGEFRHEEDGRYTFRQPAWLEDGRAAWVTGDRIDAFVPR